MSGKLKLALLGASLAAAALLWLVYPRTPLPQQTSQRLLESVIAGDYDWIYEHAFPEEKALDGFNKQLIIDFCRDHLSELDGAEIVGKYRSYLDEPTRGMSMTNVRLKDGTEIELAALGFAEEGKMLIGAMEALFGLDRLLDYEMGRRQEGWAAMRPWFYEHGVSIVYFAQTGEPFDLADAVVHDPSRVRLAPPKRR